MATKSQVQKLAKSQGATFYEGYESSGYIAEVLLPNHLVWDGMEGGACTQCKSDKETWSSFWAEMLRYIDRDVIPNPYW
tara:strand:+ start:256 stop:492 length:237 start_codon:yes stop_codon:yes gene_type:complete